MVNIICIMEYNPKYSLNKVIPFKLKGECLSRLLPGLASACACPHADRSPPPQAKLVEPPPLARCASWIDSNTRVIPRVPGDASQQSTTFLNVGECFRYLREAYVLTVPRACPWESTIFVKKGGNYVEMFRMWL